MQHCNQRKRGKNWHLKTSKSIMSCPSRHQLEIVMAHNNVIKSVLERPSSRMRRIAAIDFGGSFCVRRAELIKSSHVLLAVGCRQTTATKWQFQCPSLHLANFHIQVRSGPKLPSQAHGKRSCSNETGQRIGIPRWPILEDFCSQHRP